MWDPVEIFEKLQCESKEDLQISTEKNFGPFWPKGASGVGGPKTPKTPVLATLGHPREKWVGRNESKITAEPSIDPRMDP